MELHNPQSYLVQTPEACIGGTEEPCDLCQPEGQVMRNQLQDPRQLRIAKWMESHHNRFQSQRSFYCVMQSVRVLWDCPAYASIKSAFMLELRRELGDRFERFQSLDSFEESSYVL